MTPQSTEQKVENALTAPGALLVADSTPYDHGDMRVIALKTLAHEYRAMRAKADRLQRRVERGERDEFYPRHWLDASDISQPPCAEGRSDG